jgi:hypothetical protein
MFGMLKDTWRELLNKLSIKYLPNIITTFAILDNAQPNQHENYVDHLHSINNEPSIISYMITSSLSLIMISKMPPSEIMVRNSPTACIFHWVLNGIGPLIE